MGLRALDSVGPRCALKIVALRAKIGNASGIVLPLLAEWKSERCALKLLWCFALKFFVINFRVEDSLIFMCAAHGKKYGSFPLTKWHLRCREVCLRRNFGLTRGTVLRFFSGKMDQGMAV